MDFFQRLCLMLNGLIGMLTWIICNKGGLNALKKRSMLAAFIIACIVVMSVLDVLIMLNKMYVKEGCFSIAYSIPTLATAIACLVVVKKKNH